MVAIFVRAELKSFRAVVVKIATATKRIIDMNPEQPDSLREDVIQQDVRESLEAQLAQAEGHIQDLEGEIADLRAHMSGLDHGMCEPCAIL